MNLLNCWLKKRRTAGPEKGFSLYKAFFFFLFSSNVSVNVCVFIYYKTSDDFISAANHTLYTVH